MTTYEQSARLAEQIAARMDKFGSSAVPTMAQVRGTRDLWNHPLEWVTLNHQIQYIAKHVTPGDLRRQAEEMRMATAKGIPTESWNYTLPERYQQRTFISRAEARRAGRRG